MFPKGIGEDEIIPGALILQNIIFPNSSLDNLTNIVMLL